MPTYALLGATGATGSAILRCLLANSPHNLKLKIFIRNRGKLLKAFPDLEKKAPFPITIIEANLDDRPALQDCLKDVDVIHACIATNVSAPGTSVVQDAATAIIAALRALKQQEGPSYEPATVLIIRTSALNKTLQGQTPKPVRAIITFALYHVYNDVEKACAMYAAASKEDHVLDYIFVDPPALHDATGTRPTGHAVSVDGKMKPTLSYADLGAAFVEIAERRKEFKGKGVGVSATGKVNETWGVSGGYLFTGVKGRIFG